MSRITPLPPETTPELADTFANYVKALGYMPNSVLIMQRRPKMVKALGALAATIWDPESAVSPGFKRLLAYMSSQAAGCRYCMAHTAGGALKLGVPDEKVAALWEYRSSPLYSEAERVAMDFALAAAAVPNDVTDEMFAGLRRHWTDDQIVEIVGVISFFGFMNRWNDTMATPLEAGAIDIGERFLGAHGWDVGKHTG
jgi:uncharacterized peroxidase-related enzyme